MKVAVTSKSNDLKSEVDPRFGRCRYFIIVDIDSMSFESVSNESSLASGGAGIQAAQNIAKEGVEIVITGNMGPNAFQTLSAAGIMVFTGAKGSIEEAIKKYKNGELVKIESANVSSHFGMNATRGGLRRG